MSTVENNLLPQAIYFDANILRGIPISLESAEIITLCELAQRFDFRLFVPELAANEYFKYIQNHVGTQVTKYQEAAKYLGNLVNRDNQTNIRLNNSELNTKAIDQQKKKLNKLGIQIIPSPRLDILQTCKKFFDEPLVYNGKEGFKDVVIIESVLGHAVSENLNRIVFVSKDSAFKQSGIIKHFSDSGIELRVASDGREYSEVLSCLVQNIKDKIKQSRLELLTNKQILAKDFLNSNKDKIQSFISKNAKVDRSLWTPKSILRKALGEYNDQLPVLSKIEKINEIRLMDIKDVFPGFREGAENRYTMDFSAVLEFDVVISYLNYQEPSWSIADFPQKSEFATISPETSFESRKLKRTFYVHASVEAKSALEDKFMDLQLEEIS